MRAERVHEGREALQRIVRDLSAAYLSMHVPTSQALLTEKTAFVGRHATQFDRVDFTAFAHRRTERDSHESDQAEVGYFVARRSGRARQDGPRAPRADPDRSRSAQGRHRRTSSPRTSRVRRALPRPADRAVGRDVGLDAGDRPAEPTPARRPRSSSCSRASAQGARTRTRRRCSCPSSNLSPSGSRNERPPCARRAQAAGARSAASRSSWCSAPSPSWSSCSPSSRTTPAPSSRRRRPCATACRPSTSRGARSTSRASSSRPSRRCARPSRRSSCS